MQLASLPRKMRPPPGDPHATPAESTRPGRERFDLRLRKRVRILVAEDDQGIRELLELILRRQGWEVLTAVNGEEAVEVWGAGSVNLILMDVDMPGIDGFEATRIIREREEGTGHHTPIIALTAYQRKEDWQKSLAVGMDDYLTKPISPKLLLASIERFLSPLAE
jgi:CheY-like chemotaxis protein